MGIMSGDNEVPPRSHRQRLRGGRGHRHFRLKWRLATGETYQSATYNIVDRGTLPASTSIRARPAPTAGSHSVSRCPRARHRSHRLGMVGPFYVEIDPKNATQVVTFLNLFPESRRELHQCPYQTSRRRSDARSVAADGHHGFPGHHGFRQRSRATDHRTETAPVSHCFARCAMKMARSPRARYSSMSTTACPARPPSRACTSTIAGAGVNGGITIPIVPPSIRISPAIPASATTWQLPPASSMSPYLERHSSESRKPLRQHPHHQGSRRRGARPARPPIVGPRTSPPPSPLTWTRPRPRWPRAN